MEIAGTSSKAFRVLQGVEFFLLIAVFFVAVWVTTPQWVLIALTVLLICCWLLRQIGQAQVIGKVRAIKSESRELLSFVSKEPADQAANINLGLAKIFRDLDADFSQTAGLITSATQALAGIGVDKSASA